MFGANWNLVNSKQQSHNKNVLFHFVNQFLQSKWIIWLTTEAPRQAHIGQCASVRRRYYKTSFYFASPEPIFSCSVLITPIIKHLQCFPKPLMIKSIQITVASRLNTICPSPCSPLILMGSVEHWSSLS